MIPFQSLQGKTIAITGAGRGIGRETALALSKLGAHLALGSRKEKDLHEVSELCQAAGVKVLPVTLDVREEASVQNFLDVTVQRFGHVDGLMNSAGVGMFSSLLESSTDDFDQMVSVNLRGTYLACKFFGEQMAKQGQGHIVNLVSIAGTMALPGCGGYSASKFGVLGLTRVLQAELRQKGVQVTSVLPGAVSSSFWDAIEPKPDVTAMIPASLLAQHIAYIFNQPKGAVIDEITIMPPLGIL